jgi:hypothetical protein
MARRRGRSSAPRTAGARAACVLAALLLAGCPVPATAPPDSRTDSAVDDAAEPTDSTDSTDPADPGGGSTTGPRPPDAGAAPVEAAPGDGAPLGPVTTVDLGARADLGGAPLDVRGAADGGALLLLGEHPAGAVTGLVHVGADGAVGHAIPVAGIAAAFGLHPLPDGAVLVSGRLADQDALGYVVADPAGGELRTVTAVPLDPRTLQAVGTSAVSADGRTVWLYSSTLVDGRYLDLLTGHDVATGGLVAARDLHPELRSRHVPSLPLEPVGLVAGADGGVLLVANTFPPGQPPFWVPTLLAYDERLEPLGAPVALAPRSSAVTARAVATEDGATFVVLRGPRASTLLAVAPGGRPEERLLVPGFGLTDALVVDAEGGRALLPGRAGARSIDLTTGATTDVDVGCPGMVTVRALVASGDAGTWLLGGCFEEGAAPSTLWRIP